MGGARDDGQPGSLWESALWRLESEGEAGDGPPELGGRASIGPYRIVREISRGGMGVVFEAHDTDLGRPVAVKVLLPDAEPSVRERFLREGYAAGLVRHPAIIPVHRAGHLSIGERELPFLAMRLVSGDRTLADVPWQERMEPLMVVADAMGAAHRAGVVHRDLKPENILVTSEGTPVVTDFGLALVMDPDATRMTGSGDAIGTFHYMPAEQLLGQPELAGPAGDVYSLGVMFFEALSGRLPYEGPDAATLFGGILGGRPPSVRKYAPELSRDWETLCHVALSLEPGDRYADAGELLEDVKLALAGQRILARRTSTMVLWGRALAKRPALAVLIVTTMLLGLLGSIAGEVDIKRRHYAIVEAQYAMSERRWHEVRLHADRAQALGMQPVLAQRLGNQAANRLAGKDGEVRRDARRRAEATILGEATRRVQRLETRTRLPAQSGDRQVRPMLRTLRGDLRQHEQNAELTRGAALWALRARAAWLAGDLEDALAEFQRAIQREAPQPLDHEGWARAALLRWVLSSRFELDDVDDWEVRAVRAIRRVKHSRRDVYMAILTGRKVAAEDPSDPIFALGKRGNARRLAWARAARYRPLDPWRALLRGVHALEDPVDRDVAIGNLLAIHGDRPTLAWPAVVLALLWEQSGSTYRASEACRGPRRVPPPIDSSSRAVPWRMLATIQRRLGMDDSAAVAWAERLQKGRDH